MFRKVKGHALAKMVHAGIISARDLRGNDCSDKLATKGRNQRDDDLGNLATFYAGRQKQYIALVRLIHDFLIHVS